MTIVTSDISAVQLKTNLALQQTLGCERPVRMFSLSGHTRRMPILGFAFASVAALFIVIVQHSRHPEHLLQVQAPVTVSVHESLHAAAPKSVSSASESGTSIIAPDSVSGARVDSGSAAAVTGSTAITPQSSIIRVDHHIGVFLTAASIGNSDFLARTIDDLVSASGTALVFDVKGGTVLFHSAAPMANEIGLVRPLYELPEIIRLAHEHGLYTIGRFVAIKDGGLTGKLPETRIKDPKSGKVLSQDWVDPSDETAIRYNSEIMCELAAAGIDEINLDYIRFSTAEFGALRVYSGEEKADLVETFIRAARETIDRCGPTTKLGLSTFAILGWNYPVNVETLGQDVVRFAPLVDIISPMAYPATFSVNAYYNPRTDTGSRMYHLVYRTLTGYEELLGPEQSKKLRPWIQGYGVTSKNMTDQMDAVYDAGLCGFTVWNANNAYAPTYAAMKKQQRPERCRP